MFRITNTSYRFRRECHLWRHSAAGTAALSAAPGASLSFVIAYPDRIPDYDCNTDSDAEMLRESISPFWLLASDFWFLVEEQNLGDLRAVRTTQTVL